MLPLYTGDSLHGPLTGSHGYSATEDVYLIDTGNLDMRSMPSYQSATAYALCASNQGNSATPPTASSCQNFTYPTLDNTNVATNSYVANTDASANQFCTSK